MATTVALQGRLADITSQPIEEVTKVTVKAPVATPGVEITTSQPVPVEVAPDGTFTLNVVDGLGWLYLEGNGWSDSIRFVAAAGMTKFWEAVINALPNSAGLADFLQQLSDVSDDAAGVAQALARTEEWAQEAKKIANSIPTTVKSEVDSQVPPKVVEVIAADRTVANAAAAAVDAAAEDIKWNRGKITTATDPLTLAPGKYTVSTAAIATSMGLPGNQRGVLTVSYIDWPGKLYGKFTWEIDPSSGYELWRATSWNGTLSAWSRQFDGYVKAPLTSSTVLTDLSPGKYPVTSASIAEALKLPNPGMGMLTVDWIGSIAYQRFDWITGVNPTTHWRVSVYNRGLGSAVWEQLHPVAAAETKPSAAQKATDSIVDALIASADPTVDYATVRASLVSEMKNRIGTPPVGDAGAIALVYDHGTTAFRDWVWPELKARGLPATLALCPEIHLDPAKQDSRHLATVAEIKQMVTEGLVIASHSGDHGGAKTYTDVWRQVVVSKQTLEEAFATKVDCWVQPGYPLSEGNYMGFGTGQSADAYTNTIGGRLLQKTYPVITGYVGTESTYPANADLPVGSRRSLFEKKEDIPVVRGLVQKAADEKLKHITFVHPYAILDASDNYATKQEYLAFLDFVVQLRDAGKLKVLTLPQLAVARP